MGEVVVTGAKRSPVTFGMHVPLIASWPGRIGSGTTVADLVDTTDFLPTLLDAAGVEVRADLALDGRSFLPQLQGRQGRPRDWIYSWYSPRQLPDTSMEVREFAFNARYKLYRTGEFFDMHRDIEEQSPLGVASLTGEAAAAAGVLQRALDGYRDARPVELDRMFEQMIERQATIGVSSPAAGLLALSGPDHSTPGRAQRSSSSIRRPCATRPRSEAPQLRRGRLARGRQRPGGVRGREDDDRAARSRAVWLRYGPHAAETIPGEQMGLSRARSGARPFTAARRRSPA